MYQRTVCVALLVSLLVGGDICFVGTAMAQQKAPAKADADTEAQAKEKSKSLWLRKIDWRSSGSKIKAPEFTFRNVLQSSPKTVPDWQMITVSYDTAPDWLDRVVVNYHVLLLKTAEPAKAGGVVAKEAEEKATPYTLYEGSVAYADVKKGPSHISTMFLRPSTIERRGSVVAVGIEIVAGEETVGKSEFSATSKIKAEAKDGKWWTTVARSDQVTVRTDGLLNRSQTPFALVNYLDEEAIH